ncbi:MAG: type I DNA topoisomerase [Candidatus Omnitrophica bacterium]|nr:type I DNA topoisomerase [Candidatus Omnitrophota bacterium]
MTEKSKPVKSKKAAEKSGKYLVVVESPAKSKTINKILGKEYKVIATMGHIVDLPHDRMGIDFDNNFKPEYRVMKGRAKYVKEIKKEAKAAKAVYLAADPDREGEAICWHIQNEIKKAAEDVYRVRFGEITANAIKKAFDEKGSIDMNKVNAQQARRLLDRIVGYSLSPLLWRLIARGLSAGRVQSVAVRLVVERENAIRSFKPEEYWSLDVLLRKSDPAYAEKKFIAKLVKYKHEKVHVKTKEEADKALSEVTDQKFVVKEVLRKEKKSYPRAPYTTSVLQQDAFNKLNFSASKTMRIAQGLYEGVDLGEEGTVGLITYMRTDSVRVSEDAVKEAKEYIVSRYGEKYYPSVPAQYKSGKSAQEGHEAIRPTLPLREPGHVEKYLTADELKLYTLVWKRFVSSQMVNAVYSVLAVRIDAGDYTFRAGGAELIFDGFLCVYRGENLLGEELKEIPPLAVEEEVLPIEFVPEQHFTKAPPRYTDATLVKELELRGIGRPSTYAPTLKTVVDRNYIKRVQRYFQPTELGEVVNTLLVEQFPEIVDYEFTARMESDLDSIEDGKANWSNIVGSFYAHFINKVESVKVSLKDMKKQQAKEQGTCELCGRPMIEKWGRRGKFISCSGFPECRNARSITSGVKCPAENCAGELVERKSRKGSFYGCSKFPNCRFTAKTLADAAKFAAAKGQAPDAVQAAETVEGSTVEDE